MVGDPNVKIHRVLPATEAVTNNIKSVNNKMKKKIL